MWRLASTARALAQRSGGTTSLRPAYDQPRQQFSLLVSLAVEGADPAPESHQRIVGVDVGQRYLAVATDPQHHTAFLSGAQIRAKADHYARLRKRLQHTGTRSATRRLLVLAGRERRERDARETRERRERGG